MKTTYILTKAAILMFVRNRQALFFTLIMPLFIMLLFGYIGFDKPQKIDVGVVAVGAQAPTEQLVTQIKEFSTFTIHEGTLEEELKELSDGNRATVLVFPPDVTAISSTGERAAVTAYVNESKAGEAQAVTSILNQFATNLTLTSLHAQPFFAIQNKTVDSHNLRYIEFLLPGLIALSIMQMSVFSVAFVFTQYKEKGVLKRLLATPMKPLQFVIANSITRLIVSVLQAVIFIVMGILLFQVHIVGSYLLLAVCIVLGAFMFLGLGFSISGLAKTVDSVPVIANLTVFPMMFLGGTFFAVSNMPGWLQAVAKLLPLTFFSTSLREIMTKGSGLNIIWPDIVGMLVWTVILMALATYTFRFQERDSA